MNKLILVIATTILLSACGSSVEGTYADEGGRWELKLEADGKAILDGGVGGPGELTYEIDGDKIKLSADETNLDATFNNDGSIGFMGEKLIKRN